MSKQCRISVVVPHFESHRTISHALESIAEQSFQPMEVIVVDDCSSEGTYSHLCNIVSRFQSDDCSVRLIRRETNSGPGDCRNAGWEMALGDYVAFLDADDVWHPEKLAIVAGVLNSSPTVDFVSHRSTILEPNWNKTPLESLQIQQLKLRNFLFSNSVTTPSVTVRRDVATRFPDGRRYSEDFELWLRLSVSGMTMLHIQLPLVAISRSTDHAGLSSSRINMGLGEVLSLCRALSPSPPLWPIIPAAVAWSLLKTAIRLAGLRSLIVGQSTR